jgi:hypothetical protein
MSRLMRYVDPEVRALRECFAIDTPRSFYRDFGMLR